MLCSYVFTNSAMEAHSGLRSWNAIDMSRNQSAARAFVNSRKQLEADSEINGPKKRFNGAVLIEVTVGGRKRLQV